MIHCLRVPVSGRFFGPPMDWHARLGYYVARMNIDREHVVITMDGPAGVGKSTAARLLAATLQLAHLDTGATYRAATLLAMRQAVDMTDGPALVAAIDNADIQLIPDPDRPRVSLNGEDITQAIRDPEVTRNVHYIATAPAVRAVLVGLQRRIGQSIGRFVTEGRDQGSVVFPDADVKFFLDAAPAVRAQRRHDELIAAGREADYQTVLEEIVTRDHRDRTRETAPLVVPDGATVIDTSGKTIDEVQRELLAHVERLLCP